MPSVFMNMKRGTTLVALGIMKPARMARKTNWRPRNFICEIAYPHIMVRRRTQPVIASEVMTLFRYQRMIVVFLMTYRNASMMIGTGNHWGGIWAVFSSTLKDVFTAQ